MIIKLSTYDTIGDINNIIKIFDFSDCCGIKNKNTDINDFNKLKNMYVN
jgi:hypothetical protein